MEHILTVLLQRFYSIVDIEILGKLFYKYRLQISSVLNLLRDSVSTNAVSVPDFFFFLSQVYFLFWFVLCFLSFFPPLPSSSYIFDDLSHS